MVNWFGYTSFCLKSKHPRTYWQLYVRNYCIGPGQEYLSLKQQLIILAMLLLLVPVHRISWALSVLSLGMIVGTGLSSALDFPFPPHQASFWSLLTRFLWFQVLHLLGFVVYLVTLILAHGPMWHTVPVSALVFYHIHRPSEIRVWM